MNATPLDGRVAIVTGAGRGLGRAHAHALAAAGARVVVNNRSAEAAHEVAAEIVSAGGEAIAHVGDVADWATARGLIEHAVSALGELHILVNNAGITRDRMSFKMSEEEWDEVIRTNLKGHFAPARFAAKYWREQPGAPGEVAVRRLVNTTSEGGLFPARGHANYSASKAGILGLTLELGAELHKYGVTVNALAMRARTQMTEAVEMFAVPEAGPDPYDPVHAANVVTWLCGDDAADVSGQVLLVVGWNIGVIGPLTVTGRVELAPEWTATDLTGARDALFGGRPGLPRSADLT